LAATTAFGSLSMTSGASLGAVDALPLDVAAWTAGNVTGSGCADAIGSAQQAANATASRCNPLRRASRAVAQKNTIEGILSPIFARPQLRDACSCGGRRTTVWTVAGNFMAGPSSSSALNEFLERRPTFTATAGSRAGVRNTR
jgi:hypothetical protein